MIITNYGKKNLGFSLVEMLVILVIIGFFSSSLLLNFRSTSKNQAILQRDALIVVSAVRQAQTLAVSSSKFNGETPCGYGVHYKSLNSFVVYFGSKPNLADLCSSQNRNFNSPPDKEFSNVISLDQNVEFKNSFSDIFFEPPDPKTYINNDPSLALAPASIVIGFIGSNCSLPANCKTIQVYPSGRIDIQ